MHALSCPKGGLPSIRHNEVRDLTATLLTEVCSQVATEPELQPVSQEEFSLSTAIMYRMVPGWTFHKQFVAARQVDLSPENFTISWLEIANITPRQLQWWCDVGYFQSINCHPKRFQLSRLANCEIVWAQINLPSCN